MDFNFQWTFNVKITARDLEGNILDIQEFHNLLVNDGFDMFRGGLFGDVTDLEITNLGIGNDDGTILALAKTNTTLGNETFRFGTTDHAKPATGQHWHMVYLAPADAIGQIEELGWFCQVAGGIMISRVLYQHNKTAIESLQIERTDKIEQKL